MLYSAHPERSGAMPASTHDRTELPVLRRHLSNGLAVLVYEDHRLPQVAVNLWYHVGSKDETEGKTGFAHLFEHLMFQGSEHYRQDFFRPLEEVGARLNGSTAEDRTNYWEVVPSEYLERALWLESDRMGHLLPAIDQRALDNQREVVKNERRQNVDNEPYGVAEEAMLRALYPRRHPYHHSVIGSMEDLDRATLEDVKAFFNRFYIPNNASLCVAGDVDPSEAFDLAERYFGPIPQGEPVSPMEPDVPLLVKPVRVTVQDSVQLPRLHLEWATPPQYTQEDAALSVLAYILATGKDSRLVRRLQVDSSLAQSLWCYQGSGELCSAFVVVATAQRGEGLEVLETAVWEEIGRVVRDGVEEWEVTAAVDAIRASVVKRLQSVGGFGGLSDLFNRYQTFTSDPGYLPKDLARYAAVTPDMVREAARAHLPQGRHAMVAVVPRTQAPSAPPRDVLPGPSRPGTFSLPAVVRRKLSNGLEVWACPQRGIPLVTASLSVAAGSAQDPPARPGLAFLTAGMLDEAAAGQGPVELARRQKRLATALSTSCGADMTTLGLSLLTEHAQDGLKLLADVALRPDLRSEDLERLRKERLSDLRRLLDDVSQVGKWTLDARLYGAGSAYGHPPEGTVASLESIRVEEVAGFYRAHYGPQRALLVVVGDMEAGEMLAAAEMAFGGWSACPAAEAESASEAAAPPGLFLVDKPGAPQSLLTAGVPALSRSDPRYPAFMVFNAAVGGLFTSRINMNLREDKGYTYGARSYTDLRLGVMPWILETSVQSDKTAESVSEILRELSRVLAGEPLTQEEFEKARTGLVLRYPQNFETQAQLASSFCSLWRHSLPADFHERILQSLRRLTLEEVRAAGRDLLKPGDLVWVVVGDRASVEGPLAKAGLGAPQAAQVPVL
jgi:zinc protease